MTFFNTDARERMNEIYKITSILTHNQFNNFEEILKIACGFLKIESGIISNIKGSKYTVLDYFGNDCHYEDIKNKEFELQETFSKETLDQGKVISIDNSDTSDYKHHPFFKKYDIKVYIGTPIWINNEIFGTLSFYSKQLRNTSFTQ